MIGENQQIYPIIACRVLYFVLFVTASVELRYAAIGFKADKASISLASQPFLLSPIQKHAKNSAHQRQMGGRWQVSQKLDPRHEAKGSQESERRTALIFERDANF